MSRLKILQERTGGLSKTTKMPGHSWSIPAWECKTGGKLAQIEGSVCHGCYAMKGFYHMPAVKNALYKRLTRSTARMWVDDMAELINRKEKSGYFRWFDSGDLQGEWMLEAIAQVARRTPDVVHFLPTKEYSILRRWSKSNSPPSNLIIRASAPMVDQSIREGAFELVTSVYTDKPLGKRCPAPDFNFSCGPCRDCWNPDVKEISFGKH